MPPAAKPRVVVLGSGPNRIGQGIEFDYCCVHASFALREAGYESVMVNCNPETVSTDYDTSDRLYFEPLTVEDVLAIVEVEQPQAVIVQLGGQTPLNLARRLAEHGVPIAGTSPDSIDLAEDREQFSAVCDRLGIRQPPGGTATSVIEAAEVVDKIGLPVLVRPSYVLGGRRMRVVYSFDELADYVRDLYGEDAHTDPELSGAPILIDRFLEGAVEVDVDAVFDGIRAPAGRGHGACRGGRSAFGGFRLCHSTSHPLRRSPQGDHRRYRGAGPSPGRARFDQHPVRGQGRRRVRPGGQPTADHAPCPSSPRPAECHWPRSRPGS